MVLIVIYLVFGPDIFYQSSQNTFVHLLKLCEGNSGACLPVEQLPQPCLTIDDIVLQKFHHEAEVAGRQVGTHYG